MKSPGIPKDLLDYLQHVFPDKLPATVIPPDQLGQLLGQQSVIRHLQAQYRAQNKGMPAVI
jgi:hypothetical protein